jgi:CRP/FNR family transcriptional regulator, cyclic AMP receptor protein
VEREAAARVVQSVGWLSTLPLPFQHVVLARSDLLHYPEATPLYDVGDDASGLFGVVEGMLELHLPWKRRDNTLAHLGGPGFWAGDAGAIAGNSRRIAIRSRPGARLFRLPRAEVLRITQEDPSSWRHFAMLLAGNSLTAIAIIDALKRDDPLERVAATLLNLVDSSHVDRPVLQASQSDVGALARLGRSSVNVALAELEQRGWLRRQYGALEIIDLAALRRFAEAEVDE